MVLKDNPLKQYLFFFKDAYKLDTEEKWNKQEQEIIRDAYIGGGIYDIEFIFENFIDHQIAHGGNLFGFLIGASGSGKSLTALSIVNDTIRPALLADPNLSGDFNITWTYFETQQQVTDETPHGMVIQQDEVPLLMASESETIKKAMDNWMKQARGQRPFILFCSPDLLELPNLHFVIWVIPARYQTDDHLILTKTCCLLAIAEEFINKPKKWRIVGYFMKDVLKDGEELKTYYFVEKEENLRKNAKYGGARTAGWDPEKMERALNEVKEVLEKRYPGEEILSITNSDKILQIIKEKEIAVGSTAAEKILQRQIYDEVKDQQEEIINDLIEEQKIIVDKHIENIFDDTPGATKAAIQGLLREKLTTEEKKVVKPVFDHAWERFSILKADSKEKNIRTVEQTSSLPKGFWSYLLDLMKRYVKTSGKLKKKIGNDSWNTRLEFFYYRRILNWKPADIISLDEYPTIDNLETPRHYSNSVIKGINTSNAMKAFVGEQFFLEQFNALRTVSSVGLGGDAAVVSGSIFSVSAGKACKKLFDNSISNQPVDCWLFRDGSENPVGIVEVKFHLAKNEYDPSPGNKYAAGLGLPLFLFIIDCRTYGAKIRFGRLPEGEFFRSNLRLDTVGTVGSMDDVLQIIEKELAAAAEKNLLDQEVKA